MKSFLKRDPNENITDSITDGIIENMGYSDIAVLYPDIDNVSPNDGVDYNIFYPIINSPENFSEISAIFQYTTQSAMFSEISTLLMSIAFVEMKHLDKVRELILKLGGTIDGVNWNASTTKYGSTPIEAIKIAMNGESATISFYKKLKNQIFLLPLQNKTTEICIQLLSKLIADEELHYNMLDLKYEELLNKKGF